MTPCGHLYCWKCIYEWLQQPRATLVCPVCKSGISKEKLTPIFTKDNNDDPRKRTEQQNGGSDIPSRPAGQREEPQPNANYRGNPFYNFGGATNNFPIFFGFGVIPTIILGIIWEAMTGFRRWNQNNPEQTNEDMIKRFIFVVLVFLVMCMACFGSDVLILI